MTKGPIVKAMLAGPVLPPAENSPEQTLAHLEAKHLETEGMNAQKRHHATKRRVRAGWKELPALLCPRSGKKRDDAAMQYLLGVRIGLIGLTDNERTAVDGLISFCAMVGAQALDAMDE